MKLIDAEPIIRNLSAMETQLGYDAIEIDGMIKALREASEVFASQVVHGKWMWDDYGKMYCFNCFERPELAIEKPYCSNCGAKMDFPEDGE